MPKPKQKHEFIDNVTIYDVLKTISSDVIQQQKEIIELKKNMAQLYEKFEQEQFFNQQKIHKSEIDNLKRFSSSPIMSSKKPSGKFSPIIPIIAVIALICGVAIGYFLL